MTGPLAISCEETTVVVAHMWERVMLGLKHVFLFRRVADWCCEGSAVSLVTYTIPSRLADSQLHGSPS